MTNSKEPGFFAFLDRFLERGPLSHILILCAVCVLAYINAIGHPFVHDDVVFILQNPNIQRWDNIADAFFRPAIPQFFHGMVTPYYRPVLEVFYRLEYLFFGSNAHGFHLVNILIHLVNGVLVYILFKRITHKDVMSLVLACVFLVHPVQTEAVACISGISNLACTLFMLLAFYAYIRCVHGAGGKYLLWMVIFLLNWSVALLTKEQAVVLPVICLFYDRFFERDAKFNAVLVRWIGIVCLLMGYFYIRHSLFGGFTSAVFENMGEFKLRMMALARLIEMYGGLLFFPSGLHYYRSLDILAPNGSSWVLLGVILGLFIWGVRQLSFEEKKMVLFGTFWFGIALAPVLNIIPLVNEYSFLAAAEHNLYFPMIGFLLAFGVAVHFSASRFSFLSSLTMKRLIVLIIGIFIVCSWGQNRTWRGEIPLFQRALQYEPQLGRVHILLAKAYFQERQFDQSISEFAQAEKIISAYISKAASPKAVRFYQGMLKGIFSDTAQAYANKTLWRESIDFYSKAIALDPQDSFLYSNRALSMIARGDLELGIRELQKALALNPENLLAANNLSICFIQKGDLQKAKALLQEILTKDPGFSAARDNLNKLMVAEERKP